MYECYIICLGAFQYYFDLIQKLFLCFTRTHDILEKHQVKATQAPNTQVLREGMK